MDDALEAQRALVWDYHTRMAEVHRWQFSILPARKCVQHRTVSTGEEHQYTYLQLQADAYPCAEWGMGAVAVALLQCSLAAPQCRSNDPVLHTQRNLDDEE